MNADPRIDSEGAARYLDGRVIRTPVRRLHWLERLIGVPAWGKLETSQHTGSFKYRGALYSLREQPRSRPVIAASAGNHGLAIAEVCHQLGLKANICLPVTASRLKRERILATGAGLIEHGSSLEEAIEHAERLAREHGWRYISPYNDPDVIAANATVALEFLDQVPDLRHFIVPVGGGGLISGMALGARSVGAKVDFFGCEPQAYPTVSESLKAGSAARVIRQPTLADGLAVTLESGAVTLGLVRQYIDQVILLSEEEIAAGTFALLNHESILVEPAGAAGIAAALRLASEGKLKGPVAIPLCGGNIQRAVLSRVLQYPFTDDGLSRLLDLKGRRVSDLPIERVFSDDMSLGGVKDSSAHADLGTLLGHTRARLRQAGAELDDFAAYCRLKDLTTAADVHAELRRHLDAVDEIASAAVGRLASSDSSPRLLSTSEAVLRLALQTGGYVRTAQEWRSPSHDQSRVAQFFDLTAQDRPTTNYDRYECVEVQGIEESLLAVLGLPPDQTGVCLTSSGMAAYALLESFILRHKLPVGGRVLLPPYVYFETSEQIESIPQAKVSRAPGYDAGSVLAAVEELQPDVLFIDPLANTVEQRMVDLEALLGTLRERGRPLSVVIDGTMVSGAIPAEWLCSDERVEIFYYESCSKYLQLGLESCLAGVLAYPIRHQAQFRRLRRNTGTILYRQQAQVFPPLDRATFASRMARVSANAASVASILLATPRLAKAIEVFYPGHRSHPDWAIARRLAYAGGCVTMRFRRAGLNNQNNLEAVIEAVLHGARAAGAHLTKGVSFGFMTPRISAAASMAESELPFLRLYVGDLGRAETERLASVVASALEASLNS